MKIALIVRPGAGLDLDGADSGAVELCEWLVAGAEPAALVGLADAIGRDGLALDDPGLDDPGLDGAARDDAGPDELGVPELEPGTAARVVEGAVELGGAWVGGPADVPPLQALRPRPSTTAAANKARATRGRPRNGLTWPVCTPNPGNRADPRCLVVIARLRRAMT